MDDKNYFYPTTAYEKIRFERFLVRGHPRDDPSRLFWYCGNSYEPHIDTKAGGQWSKYEIEATPVPWKTAVVVAAPGWYAREGHWNISVCEIVRCPAEHEQEDRNPGDAVRAVNAAGHPEPWVADFPDDWEGFRVARLCWDEGKPSAMPEERFLAVCRTPNDGLLYYSVGERWVGKVEAAKRFLKYDDARAAIRGDMTQYTKPGVFFSIEKVYEYIGPEVC